MPDPFATLLLENVQPRPGRGAWHGGPTSVGALRGVTALQAVWSPAPGRKSVWQLALHIAYWNYAVRRRLEGGRAARFPRSPANWPQMPKRADAKAWAEDVGILKAEHELLVAAIEKIPSSRYGTALAGGKRWTIGELIVGIAQHDAYHTGQIQLLKRLWQAEQSPSGLKTDEEVAALRGARRIPQPKAFTGPDPTIYAFTKVQFNATSTGFR